MVVPMSLIVVFLEEVYDTLSKEFGTVLRFLKCLLVPKWGWAVSFVGKGVEIKTVLFCCRK